MTSAFAAGGAVLLLVGGTLSTLWFEGIVKRLLLAFAVALLAGLLAARGSPRPTSAEAHDVPAGHRAVGRDPCAGARQSLDRGLGDAAARCAATSSPASTRASAIARSTSASAARTGLLSGRGHADLGVAVLFTAVATGGLPRPTAFQLFIGCIPTSAAAPRGETAVRHTAAYVPAKPIDRRVIRKRLSRGDDARRRALPGGDPTARRDACVRIPNAGGAGRRSSAPCAYAARPQGGSRAPAATVAASVPQRRRSSSSSTPSAPGDPVSFEAPELLLGLLLVPIAGAGYWLLQRRPPRFAVRYTNLDVLAGVAGRRRA